MTTAVYIQNLKSCAFRDEYLVQVEWGINEIPSQEMSLPPSWSVICWITARHKTYCLMMNKRSVKMPWNHIYKPQQTWIRSDPVFPQRSGSSVGQCVLLNSWYEINVVTICVLWLSSVNSWLSWVSLLGWPHVSQLINVTERRTDGLTWLVETKEDGVRWPIERWSVTELMRGVIQSPPLIQRERKGCSSSL